MLATNSVLVIPVFLQLHFADCYELCQIMWSNKGINHQIATIKGFENLSLWQKFRSIAEHWEKCIFNVVLMSRQTLSFHVSSSTAPRIKPRLLNYSLCHNMVKYVATPSFFINKKKVWGWLWRRGVCWRLKQNSLIVNIQKITKIITV